MVISDATQLLRATTFWTEPAVERTRTIMLEENLELIPQDGERLVVIVPAGASGVITERNGAGTYTVDIIVHENASVQYHSITLHSANVRRFAYLQQDATLQWTDYSAAATMNAEVITYLAGAGSSAKFTSAFLGVKNEQYTMRTAMIHAASKSTSTMLTRAALLANAKGSYDGMIRILPHAAGCDAYQRQDTLLLSDEAKMHAQPNLEISNEDVRCSHGVSLSKLDDEKLFYFQARGIGTKEAVQLIIAGFFQVVADEFDTNAAHVQSHVQERLEAAK